MHVEAILSASFPRCPRLKRPVHGGVDQRTNPTASNHSTATCNEAQQHPYADPSSSLTVTHDKPDRKLVLEPLRATGAVAIAGGRASLSQGMGPVNDAEQQKTLDAGLDVDRFPGTNNLVSGNTATSRPPASPMRSCCAECATRSCGSPRS
ncbi:hypothetical protein ADIAG_03204 [Paeniglutamicibacter gangotriensis Lz1y]|uniref:Uncharacterized protein n=1 Tax=Paeniglutamicibacter gangotriensis Lz1y TaxID=1276920 RepID=M7N6L8_9MICC|nr:hypothetical protein ADIAG_03204 [Paeniglutamicibacter gangotriensis Lz1y]